MERITADEIWNEALECAADVVRHHRGENFVGIGGNMGWRKLDQDGLADAILTLKEPDELTKFLDTEKTDRDDEIGETKARDALTGLRDAMKAGITRDDGAHRVLLSDGSIVEGQAAIEWHALMTAIIDLADSVLGKAAPWRAYPSASWPEEPVEADHVGSFATLEEAQAECGRHRKGGFGDFVIHETTREVWKRPVGGEWIRIAEGQVAGVQQ
jgi:hypothetical protein